MLSDCIGSLIKFSGIKFLFELVKLDFVVGISNMGDVSIFLTIGDLFSKF